MQFSLTTIQLIILTSSPTLASDYALPLHLVSRQSSFFCPVVWLLYPDTWKSCGNDYITPDCTCCHGLIGCLTQTRPVPSTPRVDPSAATTPHLIARQHLVEEDARQRAKCPAVATAAFQLDMGAVPMTLITGAAHWSNIAVTSRMGRRHAV
jgi:hypothetical protein